MESDSIDDKMRVYRHWPIHKMIICILHFDVVLIRMINKYNKKCMDHKMLWHDLSLNLTYQRNDYCIPGMRITLYAVSIIQTIIYTLIMFFYLWKERRVYKKVVQINWLSTSCIFFFFNLVQPFLIFFLHLRIHIVLLYWLMLRQI